jgi:CheY-like chemotaxis protein
MLRNSYNHAMMTMMMMSCSPLALEGSSPVLIVDDDDDMRETLRVCLEEEGFAVRTARNGREALDLLAAGALPGLILLDLMMPEMNGWEVLERLRDDAVRAEIPVAVMSGSHRGDVKSATYVVPKPFDLGVMIDLVQEHCSRKAAFDAAAAMRRPRSERAPMEALDTSAA